MLLDWDDCRGQFENVKIYSVTKLATGTNTSRVRHGEKSVYNKICRIGIPATIKIVNSPNSPCTAAPLL